MHSSEEPNSRTSDLDMVEKTIGDVDAVQVLEVERIGTTHTHEKKTKEERRLLLKADLVILPLCSLTYFVAYLDRNSIGNARVLGLQKDLSMTPDQFFNCLALFFVGYLALMLPANLLTRKLKPNRSLGAAVVFFGAICCATAGAKNYATLIALRTLLGCGQAFIQTTTVYMSLWYKRDEMATRFAIFFGCATLSGAFGGLIAYGIGKDLQSSSLRVWEWLFLIEGIIAIAAGIVIYLALPRYPDDLQQMSSREKKHWLFTRREIDLASERFQDFNTAGAKPQAFQLLAVLKDPKSYCFAVIQATALLGVSNVGSFLPTFVTQFGYSPVRTQLFLVIPYACAGTSIILSGYFSDRLNFKFPFLLSAYIIGTLGYIILLCTSGPATGVVATCLVTSGCYVSVFMSPVWMTINTAGFTKRGATWAFSEVFGLCFSIMGTRIYNSPPRFVRGHSVVLSLNVVGVVAVILAFLRMRFVNRRKDMIERELQGRGEVHQHVREGLGLEDVMDAHIKFRYVL